MKLKIIQLIPVCLAIISIGFDKFSRSCIYVNHVNGPCYATWVSQVFDYFTSPLYVFSLYFLPIAIVLIFIRRDIFVWWAKFSVLLFLFAFLYIATTPVSSGGFLYGVTRDDSAQVAAVLVDLASVIFIIFKYRQARKIRTS